MAERKRKSISIRPDLHQWMQEQIQKSRFHNFSHAIEIALEKLRASETEGR